MERRGVKVAANVEEWMLYEDSELLVCRKPAGLAVQTRGIGQMDLESFLKNYLGKKQPGVMPYLAVIHRLDQPVEGILVFAKTPGAAGELSRQMQKGTMTKEYLAVVRGVPETEEGILEDYLKKDGRANSSFVVREGTQGAKKARLSYRLLDEREGRSLLRIHLDTGRHHQIRVQLAHRGMPLVGDKKYGDGEGGALGLCAVRLAFVHPVKKTAMEFQVRPQGEPFQEFLSAGAQGF